jgi:LPS sulfotransferase NodH
MCLALLAAGSSLARAVDVHPRTSYLICTTPRSGSTLLCELLADSGVAGRPDEYFQQLRTTGLPMMPADYLDGVAADLVPAADRAGRLEQHTLYDPRRFETFAAYVEWVVERATTANGVFGAKIMWPYVAGLVDGLSAPRRVAGAPATHELLARTFPRLRYVWLRRMDKVRQAVSLWRAIQTWRWREDAGRARAQESVAPARYSFEAIDHLRRRLVADDRAWELYFEAGGAVPLTLTYEEFTDEIHETVVHLLRHVGVSCPEGARFDVPRTARQSDQLSERWVAAFKADFAQVPAVG